MSTKRNGRKWDQNAIGGRRKEAWEIPYDSEEDEEGFDWEVQEEQDKSEPTSLAADEEEWEAGKYLSYQTESRVDEFGELEHHTGDSENEEIYDFELDGELADNAFFEDIPGVTHHAQIQIQKDRTDSKPAEVALIVHRWSQAERARISGTRLKPFECDIGEPGRSDAATAQNDLFAEFSLDLEPNPEFVKNPSKAGMPRVSIARARWDEPRLEKSYKASRRADLVLRIDFSTSSPSGPGLEWSRLLVAKGGPLAAVLGYRAAAPCDSPNGDNIAQLMAGRMATGSTNFARDWLEINGDNNANNAVALDARGYWWIEGTLLGGFDIKGPNPIP